MQPVRRPFDCRQVRWHTARNLPAINITPTTTACCIERWTLASKKGSECTAVCNAFSVSRKVTTKTEQGVYCAAQMARGVMQRLPGKPRFVLVSWRKQNWRYSFCSSRWIIYHSLVLRRVLIAHCHVQNLSSSTHHTGYNTYQRPLQQVLTQGGSILTDPAQLPSL